MERGGWREILGRGVEKREWKMKGKSERVGGREEEGEEERKMGEGKNFSNKMCLYF